MDGTLTTWSPSSSVSPVRSTTSAAFAEAARAGDADRNGVWAERSGCGGDTLGAGRVAASGMSGSSSSSSLLSSSDDRSRSITSPCCLLSTVLGLTSGAEAGEESFGTGVAVPAGVAAFGAGPGCFQPSEQYLLSSVCHSPSGSMMTSSTESGQAREMAEKYLASGTYQPRPHRVADQGHTRQQRSSRGSFPGRKSDTGIEASGR